MTQREKLFIGLAAAAGVVFGVPMVMDAFSATRNADLRIARMQSDRADREAEAKLYLERTKQLQPKVHMLAWDIPPDQLRQAIVRRVSNVARSSGATLITTHPLKPRSLDVMTEVGVELRLSTDLPSLVKFLFPLQQDSSRLSVDKVRMAVANSESDLLDVDLTVSGYTLQLPPDAKPFATGKTGATRSE